jgi:hypothetical protein
MKHTILLLSFLATACGSGGTPDTSVTKPCVSNIVTIMSQMTSPFFEGMGTPDSITTFPIINGQHSIEYDFKLLHKRLTFIWTDQGICKEIETTI